jgi:hypothetical protein
LIDKNKDRWPALLMSRHGFDDARLGRRRGTGVLTAALLCRTAQAEGQEPSPDEAPPAEAAPADAAPEEQPAAADAPAEEQPAAAAPAEEEPAAAAPAEEPAPEAGAEAAAAAAPAPAPSAGKIAGKALGIAGRYARGALGYTAEGVPIGFGVGKSPPRASKFERCCYCPLYNTTTGDVIAWVPNPPKYPAGRRRRTRRWRRRSRRGTGTSRRSSAAQSTPTTAQSRSAPTRCFPSHLAVDPPPV